MSKRFRELVEEGYSEAEALRVTTTVDCSVEPSRTKQSFAEEADINFVVSRFMKTGYLPPVEEIGGPQPRFGDFSDGMDFMDALSRVQEAQASFAGLPAAVRERFRNDPAELLVFVSDSGNRAEAVKLGLIADTRAVEARSERTRVSDLRARELEAAERRGREAAEPPGGRR